MRHYDTPQGEFAIEIHRRFPFMLRLDIFEIRMTEAGNYNPLFHYSIFQYSFRNSSDVADRYMYDCLKDVCEAWGNPNDRWMYAKTTAKVQ